MAKKIEEVKEEDYVFANLGGERVKMTKKQYFKTMAILLTTACFPILLSAKLVYDGERSVDKTIESYSNDLEDVTSLDIDSKSAYYATIADCIESANDPDIAFYALYHDYGYELTYETSKYLHYYTGNTEIYNCDFDTYVKLNGNNSVGGYDTDVRSEIAKDVKANKKTNEDKVVLDNITVHVKPKSLSLHKPKEFLGSYYEY